jgi:hypothetical protein
MCFAAEWAQKNPASVGVCTPRNNPDPMLAPRPTPASLRRPPHAPWPARLRVHAPRPRRAATGRARESERPPARPCPGRQGALRPAPRARVLFFPRSLPSHAMPALPPPHRPPAAAASRHPPLSAHLRARERPPARLPPCLQQPDAAVNHTWTYRPGRGRGGWEAGAAAAVPPGQPEDRARAAAPTSGVPPAAPAHAREGLALGAAAGALTARGRRAAPRSPRSAPPPPARTPRSSRRRAAWWPSAGRRPATRACRRAATPCAARRR